MFLQVTARIPLRFSIPLDLSRTTLFTKEIITAIWTSSCSSNCGENSPSQSFEWIFLQDFIESQMKHSEDLEEKFDKLLKTKRDLESRINRIPTRGLTNTDRQLLEVLEREIDRVEQQISSVKLELRKMNILRTHWSRTSFLDCKTNRASNIF